MGQESQSAFLTLSDFSGSGRVRKLRWRVSGRGKRGGYRVIYFAKPAQGVIWMVTMYLKNVAENIPAHVLRGEIDVEP